MANTSRRALLGGIAALSAVASIGVAGAAPSNRAAWDRAFAAYQRARDLYEAHSLEDDRTWAVWQAEKPSFDHIKWRQVPGYMFAGDRERLAYFEDLDKLTEFYVTGENKWWWGTLEAKQKSLAAIHSIRKFRADTAACRERLGVDESSDRNDQLGDAMYEAHTALMTMPAPDHQALLWKLETIITIDDGSTTSWSDFYVAQTLADMRRLLGGEG